VARKKNKDIVDVKSLGDALGKDKLEEVVGKEWKVAELPSEEDLSREKHESSMARTNKNSRSNLIQYRKEKTKETKERVIKGLKHKSKRPDKDLAELFGDLISEDLLEILVPMREVVNSADEEDLFFGIMKRFVSDIPKGELNSFDLDDICNLALNRVLEVRLLKAAKESPKMILDAASTIERFRKNSEKLKANLASRRTDRVDTKNKQSFSIVDLAVGFDEKKREEFERRAQASRDTVAAFVKGRKNTPLKIDDDGFGDR
jgi:hypothetical protein